MLPAAAAAEIEGVASMSHSSPCQNLKKWQPALLLSRIHHVAVRDKVVQTECGLGCCTTDFKILFRTSHHASGALPFLFDLPFSDEWPLLDELRHIRSQRGVSAQGQPSSTRHASLCSGKRLSRHLGGLKHPEAEMEEIVLFQLFSNTAFRQVIHTQHHDL